MKLGIHAYAWCSEWSNETLGLIDKVRDFGMDFIELPLMCLETFDSKAVKERLGKAGLDAVTSTVLTAGTDITSEDERIRQAGVDYLKECVRAASEVGAGTFCGVIYSQHVKDASAGPDERAWRHSAECLREVARFARPLGVTLGIEPVNRYETYMVNTCEQALRLMEMVGEENVKVHLDSYHMNIEEKSFYDATKTAGSDLIHYHLCENDRGIPGTGLVDWDDIFRALGEMEYRGNAALESFVDVTDNMTTWVWRRLAPSGDTLLREGAAFIRGMMEKYGLG